MFRVSGWLFGSISLLFDYMCMRLPLSPWSIAGVLRPGASGLPHYCTSLVRIPDVIGCASCVTRFPNIGLIQSNTHKQKNIKKQMCVCMSAYVYTCVSARACMHVRAYVYVRTCHVSICIRVCVCVSACVCVFLSYLQYVPRNSTSVTASLSKRRGFVHVCLGLEHVDYIP